MVKHPLSSFDAEDCVGALRKLASGKRWMKHSNDGSDPAAWATNELNLRRRFFRNAETLNTAKKNVGDALAMVELSLMATSACTDTWYDGYSLPHRSSKQKKKKHRHGHSRYTKDSRFDRESREDAGYFSSRHLRGRIIEHEACRDRVNRARSFQVRRTTSHDEIARNGRGGPEAGPGRGLRRSSSERTRPVLHPWPLRSSSTGTSPSPLQRRKDLNSPQTKDRKSGSSGSDGRSIYPGEETVVMDPNTGAKYKKGKLLGKGGFAKCYEFLDVKSKEKFAGKVVSKNRMANPRTREKIIREVEIHRHLEHPNVVTFYGFFECKGSAYLILEHCVQRSMVHVLTRRKTLTEPEVRYYMLQLVSGCRYIHGRKIIHRDLKLGNMLLDDQMRIKIADFGLATKVLFDGEKKTSLCGTPNYIAPEVLQKKGHSYEADIWALGCVMYTMLCGQPPFETNSLKETYQRIISSRFTTPSHVTQPAALLISKMLSVDPSSRPTLARIIVDDFFLSGYTPTTLSTFCCHTAPRFPLTIVTNAQTWPTYNTGSLKLKKENQNNVHPEKNKQTKSEFERLVQSTGTENQKNTKPEIKNSNSTLCTQTSNQKHTDIKHSTIAPNGTNFQSYDKTFRLGDPSGTLRLSEKINGIHLGKQSGSHLSQITDSHQTSDDTQVAETTETSFGPLYQLMTDTLRRHDNKDSAVPSSASSFSSSSSSSSSSSLSCNPPLWITKWVDYSNKYGFGYQLSDGRTGILFSDSGHILLSPDEKSVNYTSRLNKSHTFSLDKIPSKLQKKLLVVLHLASYMKEHLIKGGDIGSNEDTGNRESVQAASSMVFLQKWYRDQNVIVMQLNNGTLQVNFFKDHSKLIAAPPAPGSKSEDYVLTYVSRGRPATTWPLANTKPSAKTDPEVIDRIRQTLEFIDQAENTMQEHKERTILCPDDSKSPLKGGKFVSPTSTPKINGRKDLQINTLPRAKIPHT